jgi:HEAT repeat protein
MVRNVNLCGRYAGAIVTFVLLIATLCVTVSAQEPSADDARVQREISFQQERLGNADAEVRRDAVLHLRAMRRADASRAGAVALGDALENVRAAACAAVVSMPGDEAAGVLIPMLGDKLPFVRQEAAYALGKTHSRNATAALINTLQTDGYLHVRAAAAVALGEIADPAAAAELAAVVSGAIGGKLKDKSDTERDFLRRSAAIALGQMGSRAGVPALIAILNNRDDTPDVRREAARALGLIGDPSAHSALQSALSDRDPYLSEIAFNALARISELRN